MNTFLWSIFILFSFLFIFFLSTWFFLLCWVFFFVGYREGEVQRMRRTEDEHSSLFSVSVLLQREEGRCRVQVQVDLNFKLKIYLNLKISSWSLPKFQFKIWNFSFRARKGEFLKSSFLWIFPIRNVDFPWFSHQFVSMFCTSFSARKSYFLFINQLL